MVEICCHSKTWLYAGKPGVSDYYVEQSRDNAAVCRLPRRRRKISRKPLEGWKVYSFKEKVHEETEKSSAT